MDVPRGIKRGRTLLIDGPEHTYLIRLLLRAGQVVDSSEVRDLLIFVELCFGSSSGSRWGCDGANRTRRHLVFFICFY